jgi:hypothetical protein
VLLAAALAKDAFPAGRVLVIVSLAVLCLVDRLPHGDPHRTRAALSRLATG